MFLGMFFSNGFFVKRKRCWRISIVPLEEFQLAIDRHTLMMVSEQRNQFSFSLCECGAMYFAVLHVLFTLVYSAHLYDNAAAVNASLHICFQPNVTTMTPECYSCVNRFVLRHFCVFSSGIRMNVFWLYRLKCSVWVGTQQENSSSSTNDHYTSI